MPRFFAVALTASAVLWLLVIVYAPFAIAHGPSGWPVLVYQAAGLICHQRSERSFHLAGMQMPVCARCAGLYASGAVGALIGWVRASRLAPRLVTRARVALIVAAMPTALTLVAEWIGAAHPSNAVRAIAAAPLGAITAFLLVQWLREERRSAAAADGMRYHA